MTAATAELVQVHYQKLKNINFSIVHLTQQSVHTHSCLELGVVLDGKAHVQCNDTAYSAQTGSLLLFNAYEAHSIQPDPDVKILFLQLAPGFGKEYFSRIVNVEFIMDPAQLPSEAKESILYPLIQAATVFFREPVAFGIECAGWVAHCVAAMLRDIPYRLNTDAEYMIKKKKIGRQQRIASFVEQHYREKLTLSQLAQSEGITTAYMSRIFGELCHTSFQEYLSRLRLQKAIPMLKKPSIYLVDICMECGFSDTRYLNAVCQKEYGCTATQLREQMQDPNWVDPKQEPQMRQAQFDDSTSLQLLQDYLSRQQK